MMLPGSLFISPSAKSADSLDCKDCVLSQVCTCSHALPCLSPPLHVSVMECVLVVAFSFPSLSSPLSMGTLGLRQSFVVKATSCVAELRTPGIWSLSLSVFFPLLFLFHLSLRFSLVLQRLAEHPVLFFLMLSSAFHPQKYSHMHNETHTVENKICVLRFYHSLPFPPPHFTFSVVVILRSLSIPMWGFKYGFAGYHSPLSPQAYITVSSLLWNTTALFTGLRFKFSSLDLKCNNIDLNLKLNSSDWCQSRYHTDVTVASLEK